MKSIFCSIFNRWNYISNYLPQYKILIISFSFTEVNYIFSNLLNISLCPFMEISRYAGVLRYLRFPVKHFLSVISIIRRLFGAWHYNPTKIIYVSTIDIDESKARDTSEVLRTSEYKFMVHMECAFQKLLQDQIHYILKF